MQTQIFFYSRFKQGFSIVLLFVSLIIPFTAIAQSSTIDCDCDTKVVHPTSGNFFYPQLQTITNYADFVAVTGWQLPGKEKAFSSLFAKNYMPEVGSGEQNAILTILSYKSPIKLIHPDDSFTINLTPCVSGNHIFDVPLVVHYSNPVLRYDHRFDYKKFNHSARAYLHLFIAIGARSEDILKRLLEDKVDNDDNRLTGFSKFIDTVNKKYGLGITIEATDKSIVKQNIPGIIQQIEHKKIKPEIFITNEFIVTDDTQHAINDKEKERLQSAVDDFIHFTGFDDFDKNFLQPKCNAGAEVKRIDIEINKEVLRKWDDMKRGPVLDSAGKSVRLPILTDVAKLDFSTQQGVDAKITGICPTTAEITGTGITLYLENAELIDKLNHPNFDEHNYPLFLLGKPGGKKLNGDGMVIFEYDTLLNNFSGLLVHTAKIYIPFRNNTITGEAQELIVNNKLISGTISIAIHQLPNNKNGEIKLQEGNKTIVTNIREVESSLKKHGITSLKLQKQSNSLYIFFKKTYTGIDSQ
jgi:hypothetical protein